MNLIYVLVIAVSVLTILSALALIFGSSKAEKVHSLWFLAAAVGEVLWGVSIAVMLSLPPTETAYEVAPWLIRGIYVGAMLMDSTILGYVAWKYKFGKILTSVFLIAGAVMATIFLYDPSVLYTSVNLAHGGNSITLNMESGFYIAYIVYFCTIVPAFCLSLVYKIRKSTNKEARKGYLFFMVGLAIAGAFSLVYDLILPIWRYDLIWVGPLLIGFTMLGFYYAVLRYHMITLAAGWLKILSSVVIVSGAVIIYLLIFHLVFSSLFRVNSPSWQVVLLNFIMIAIVLCLAPAISEMMAFTRSMITTKQIDIAYIVKKLTKLNSKKLNLKDVSGFLAEHMNFAFVGFLVNGRFYVADDYKIPAEKVTEVEKLAAPARGVWQDVGELGATAKEYGISRVATITNASGEVVGQMVFGKPASKANLDREDLTRTEMIISLMGTMIGNGSRKS